MVPQRIPGLGLKPFKKSWNGRDRNEIINTRLSLLATIPQAVLAVDLVSIDRNITPQSIF